MADDRRSNRRKGGDHPADQLDLAARLLDFAEPVLESGEASAVSELLHSALTLCATAWNIGVVWERDGARAAKEARDEVLRVGPAADREELRELFDMLIERKREDFGGDLREVDALALRRAGTRWRARSGPSKSAGLELDFDRTSSASARRAGGDGAARKLEQRRAPKKRAPSEPARFVVDLRHYATDNGLLIGVPRPARELARHFGAIAAAASRAGAEAGRAFELEVACRRRTGAKRCTARIHARLGTLDEPLEWSCPGCGESGSISGWRGSVWDHRTRERELAELPASERFELKLSDVDRRTLEQLEGLAFESLSVLAAARRGESASRGGSAWRLTVSRRELEDLTLALAAATVEGEWSDLERRVFTLTDQFYDVLGYGEAASEAADTAAVLAFRARADPTLCRSAPRVAGSGAHRLAVELELDELAPAVRRELLVRSDTTLEELHAILQVAFGWTESHLHAFVVGRARYMNVRQSEDSGAARSDAVTLLEALPRPGAELRYDYDFGDDWRHRVRVLELAAAKPDEVLPRCLSGQNAAPPEDVGGPGGYAQLLEALADPAHEQHEELREWCGGPFDPRAFDLEHTNRLLAQLGRWQSAGS